MDSREGPDETAASETVAAAPGTAVAEAAGEGGSPAGQDPARTAAAEGQPLTEKQSLQFELHRNASYHDDRERFFDGVHRVLLFLVVAGGSAAAAEVILDLWPFAKPWLALGTAAAGLVDLVYDTSGKARRHNALRRLSFELLADLERGSAVHEVRARLYSSYGEEPAVNHTVGAIAYNEAMKALGRPARCLFKISRLRRHFRHLTPWPSRFSTYEELGEEPPAIAST